MAEKFTPYEVIDFITALRESPSFSSSSNSEINKGNNVESASEGEIVRDFLSFNEDEGLEGFESSMESDTEENMGEACCEDNEFE